MAYGIDRVRAGDRAALVGLFNSCSAETVYRRFFGWPTAFPRTYLASVLAARPEVHDAVVVRYGDGLRIAGLASLAAASGDEDAELGVLVADGWQRRGLGAAMVDVLLTRARERGVEHLTASVLRTRPTLLGALGRRLELQRLTPSEDTLTGLFRLPAASDDRSVSDVHQQQG